MENRSRSLNFITLQTLILPVLQEAIDKSDKIEAAEKFDYSASAYYLSFHLENLFSSEMFLAQLKKVLNELD